MSWSQTYSHTLAIAVDVLTASLFWNTQNVTVSSLAGLALRRGETKTALALIGRGLNRLQSGHCEKAIAADIDRSDKARVLLTSVPPKA